MLKGAKFRRATPAVQRVGKGKDDEWTILVVDEAAQVSEAALESLDARVRSTVPVLSVPSGGGNHKERIKK